MSYFVSCRCIVGYASRGSGMFATVATLFRLWITDHYIVWGHWLSRADAYKSIESTNCVLTLWQQHCSLDMNVIVEEIN